MLQHVRKQSILALATMVALNAGCAEASDLPTLTGAAPIVIGHRGASGYRPEHTLASYALAIELGADYIEPDLVLTQDGHLIARHEPAIGGTTDVADHPEFADRKTTKVLDGVPVTDWFASDFTLAEIKTLKAKERLPALRPGNTAYDGLYEIPTLDEVIELAKRKGEETGRTIGIYPEIKHSTFHAGLFGEHVFEDKLLKKLHKEYGNSECAPVFIQSFEVGNLRYLARKTHIKRVQLVDANGVNADGSISLVPPSRQPYDFVVSGDARTFGDLLTDEGLDFVKSYADAIGPWKPYLVKTVDDGVDRNGDGRLTINDRLVVGSTGVIEQAHEKGLLVHTWTFRNDSSGYGFSDPQAEIRYYFELGVDGLFTDFADTGVAARAELVEADDRARLSGQCAYRHEHGRHERQGERHRD
ncbi:glycerophosphodiester phosphodiesterase [Methylococcus sp. EFPC2]|uniref:glycerophosphodiester phosphodiesterase n=1 Tax=Methylococcus sp. EFPC2 TaxID=2812648 RepID=UPI001967AF97|nr:glycerophosphodiester phosphodiesterase [Methylococcus sp. EFPC2]QSA97314.1 glycerophosphodiester phosphodiesterase [Methylococcus sp. EFPC2]